MKVRRFDPPGTVRFLRALLLRAIVSLICAPAQTACAEACITAGLLPARDPAIDRAGRVGGMRSAIFRA